MRTSALSAAALACCGLAACAAAVPPTDFVLVSVMADDPVTPPLPPDFASVSVEVAATPQVLTLNGKPRPSYINIMKTLQAESGGRGPNIRVGGSSTDESVWDPSGKEPLPPHDTIHLGPADLEAYTHAALWNGTVTIGVNFRNATDPTFALQWLAALEAGGIFPLIDGLEIGNEPDIYSVYNQRPLSYNFDDYTQDFAFYIGALEQAGYVPSKLRIQGAVFCCDMPTFGGQGLLDYINRWGNPDSDDVTGYNMLTSVSYHRYPLTSCRGSHPTIDELMQDSSSVGLAAFLQPIATTANAAGARMVVGEGNSVACGGLHGVSDTFASALWALDTLSAFAFFGVSRFNLHGGSTTGAYSPVLYQDLANDTYTVMPVYYGMWLFTRAIAGDASLTSVLTLNTTQPLIKTWAFTLPLPAGADPNAVPGWRMLVIHKALNATGPAQLCIRPPSDDGDLPANQPTGALDRLTAPAVNASTGVQLSGQTFDGTKEGIPAGARTTEPVPFSITEGCYLFTLEPASAALLSVPTFVPA